MKRHPVRKGLVGLATVFAFLVLSAAQPAGAAEIEDGDLLIGGTEASPTLVFPLGAGAPEAPCVPIFNPPLVPFYLEEWVEGNPGTWEAEGGFVGAAQLLGNWIKAQFDFSGLAGQTWPTADPDVWDLTGGGEVIVDLYDINFDPEDPEKECEKKDLICRIVVEVVLIPISHRSYAADAHWPGDHLYLNANSVAPHLQIGFFDCEFVIWLALAGQPAWIRDLVISLP